MRSAAISQHTATRIDSKPPSPEYTPMARASPLLVAVVCAVALSGLYLIAAPPTFVSAPGATVGAPIRENSVHPALAGLGAAAIAQPALAADSPPGAPYVIVFLGVVLILTVVLPNTLFKAQ